MPETNVCQQSRTIWAAEPERARRKRRGQRARGAALVSLAPCQNNACGIGNQCESVEAEDKSDAVPLPRKAKEDVEKKLKRRKDASCLPLHVWKPLNELIRMAPTTNVRRNRWNQRLTTSSLLRSPSVTVHWFIIVVTVKQKLRQIPEILLVFPKGALCRGSELTFD